MLQLLLRLHLCLLKKKKSLGDDDHMGPQVHIKEPGGSLSVTHEIGMLGYEKRGRDR